jgi:regulator of protease activity HflC (stomatin/prohibitin superfamily)
LISELLGILVQIWNVIWPFQIVAQWEQGNYYVFGRYWKTVGPGLYPVVPWFFKIIDVSVARGIVGTGRQDITTADGGTLSYAATAPLWVRDANKAINDVDDVKTTAQELFTSVLSEKLADVDAGRLDPQSRGRLVSDLQRWCNTEGAEWGLEFGRVRFTSYVRNVKTYRLLTDANAVVNW